MKIRAAVMYEQGKPAPYAQSRPLVVEDVELDGPGPGEVLVKVAAAGLCHSDLSAIAGLRPRAVPTVVGHESAGVVSEVGEGVTDLVPGDHVVMVFVASCGHCAHCDRGRPNLCEASWGARTRGTLQSGARRLRTAAVTLNHYSGLSAFAEYAVVSRASLVRIEKDIPLADAAIFGCAVITGVGAVVNTAKVQVGATVAVVGLGGVGLSAILGAAAAGASRIIAIDLREGKLALARELGATDAFNASQADLARAVLDATAGGVDYAFEMAGVSASMETAYAVSRRGGTVVVAGLPDPKQRFAVPLASHVADERVIAGSYMGSCVPRRDIPRFLELYRRGRLPVNRLRSGTVTLDGINEGFDRLARGESVRDVLTFD